MNRINRLLLLLFTLVTTQLSADELSFSVSDDVDLPVKQYLADGDTLLLWIPSEYGTHDREGPIVTPLVKKGIATWVVDLHGGYFEPIGRSSLSRIPEEHMLKLLNLVMAQTNKKVVIFTAGRGAKLMLTAVHQWQRQHADNKRLVGLILMHPNLYDRTLLQAGQQEQYLPVVSASNIPIYILQPSLSAKNWRLSELAQALEKGGSPVYTQVLYGAGDGFYERGDITNEEQAVKEKLSGYFARAITLLKQQNKQSRQPPPMLASTDADEPSETENRPVGLQAYQGPALSGGLNFPDLTATMKKSPALKGKVTLLNFWATWCPPCIKEIPSLERLNQKLAGKQFQVISIDVGEDADTVNRFLKDKPIQFPVLLDAKGDSVREWRIHGFPTTYVLDKNGVIRYAVIGGLEWDTDEIIGQLNQLME